MVYLLIGRFASGRKYLADILKQYIKPDTDTNSKFTENLSEENIIQNNILIISPEQLETITAADRKEPFILIHVQADDIDRRLNYVKNTDKKIQAEQEFDSIDENEDAEYCDFEQKMHNLTSSGKTDWLPENITRCYHYVNEYSETTCSNFASDVVADYKLNQKMIKILKELNEKDMLQGKHNDNGLLTIVKSDHSEKQITYSFFSELLMSDDKAFIDVIKRWLTLTEMEK